MTRKEALLQALEVLTDQTAKEKILEILEDMPFTRWSERTIFDTIDQFILDNKRIPTLTDFKKKGLPPHPVIKLRFGINLKEFMDKYYPTNKLCKSSVYYNQTKEYWQDFFIKEYHKNKPCKAEEYNFMRSDNSPSWGTIARLFGKTKWLEWLKFCDIIPYVNKKEPRRYSSKTVQINVFSKLAMVDPNGIVWYAVRTEEGIKLIKETDVVEEQSLYSSSQCYGVRL